MLTLAFCLFLLSIYQGSGHHWTLPDAGQEGWLCVGRYPGHRHLQHQELSTAVHCMCELRAQVATVTL